MAGNDKGVDDKRRRRRGRGRGQGKRKERDVAYFPTSTIATGSNSSSNTATSNSRTKNRHDLTTFLLFPSVRNRPSFKTACTVCKKEMEYAMICMDTTVLRPYCNDFFLASEKGSVSQIPQRKFLPPLSSTIFQGQFPERMNDLNSINVPVVDLPQQYELALKDPRYFHFILKFVSILEEKPFQVPIFQGKELINMHRIFVEITSRGGICKVSQEGRLQEVCATLNENLSDGVVLYNMYMKWLYDLETWLCNFPYKEHIPPSEYLQTSSGSFAGAYLMQGLIGGKLSSSSERASLLSRLRGEQHPSRRIQASAPYTNSAPVNNNQQSTSSQAGFNFDLTDHPNGSSWRPCPMPGVIGRQPSSSNLNSAVANNNLLWITKSSGFNYDSDFEFNLDFDFDFDLADHTLSSPPTPHPTQRLIGGQPSQQGHTSFADLNSALVNDQIIFVDHDTGRYLADNPQDFASADEQSSYLSSDWDPSEWEVQPLPQLMEVPDVCSTGHGSTQGVDPPHNQPMIVERKGLTESTDGNYEKGVSSASNNITIRDPSNNGPVSFNKATLMMKSSSQE